MYYGEFENSQLLFLTFLLPSPSSDLKRPSLPLNDGEADTLGYEDISSFWDSCLSLG